MKLIIDISDNIYDTIMSDVMPDEGQMSAIITRIYQGIPYEERPQDNLISREALKKAIDHFQYTDDFCLKHQIDNSISLYMLEKIIDNAPTVEITEDQAIDKLHETGWLPRHDKEMTERPQGKWDYEQVAFYGICSNCGVAVTSNLANIFLYEEIGKCRYNTNFCPNCGADMRGDKNDG